MSMYHFAYVVVGDPQPQPAQYREIKRQIAHHLEIPENYVEVAIEGRRSLVIRVRMIHLVGTVAQTGFMTQESVQRVGPHLRLSRLG